MSSTPEIILIQKSVLRTPVWARRSNHAGHMVAVAEAVFLWLQSRVIPIFTHELNITLTEQ
jgi:hypothetical protein